MTEACRLCKGCKWIALGPFNLAAFRQRYQWADLDMGCNDCPVCVQVPPSEPQLASALSPHHGEPHG